MTQDIFWMVYGIGKAAPSHMHHTKGDANAEAKRLSLQNPGVVFVVLEAVDAYTVPKAEPTQIKIDPNPIPF